jgi:hypothetical protein
MSRRRLPNRRAHELREITFHGQRFSVGVGRDDSGAPAEIFVGAGKTGSEYDALARDAGILLSIALQSEADLQTIRHALTRDHVGAPGSLLGAIVDEMEGR